MGGTHFLQTGYLLLNRNAPYFAIFHASCDYSVLTIQNLHSQNRLYETFLLLIEVTSPNKY